MVWILAEAGGVFPPGSADELGWSEPLQGFEPACEAVGSHEVGEVLPELVVAVVAADTKELNHPKDGANAMTYSRSPAVPCKARFPELPAVSRACDQVPFAAWSLAQNVMEMASSAERGRPNTQLVVPPATA